MHHIQNGNIIIRILCTKLFESFMKQLYGFASDYLSFTQNIDKHFKQISAKKYEEQVYFESLLNHNFGYYMLSWL